MNRILILGSEGFIGNHLVEQFLTADFVVHGCDLYEAPRKSNYNYKKLSRLSPEWEELFNEHAFTHCINASGSGNVAYSMTHPLNDFQANTLDVIMILDALRKLAPGCKYIHISSAAVYGNPVALPITEEFPAKPMSPYGWHKVMSEQICKEFHQIYGLSTVIIRPFSVYGEGLCKQLLWDLTQKLKRSDEVSLFGTGKESRDFIHVKDLCRLIHLIAMHATFQAEVYNGASGVETEIRTIADYFEQFWGTQKTIRFSGETRPGDPVNWRADVSRIHSLGFETSISLRDGISGYLKWAQSIQ